ncbi:putative glycoside hydrolase [Paenibacillus albicereus]|uniref:Putative glycoside hydrolase n=1 Tax=Paenibacillus albicereus TaxID=2726185 RepID=A0A6H2GVY0_9BACL|nr:putative glycoside hydrolase [Paenibacillus albicereus]QJC51584.1 putative glycoside hydrolase [Paenibacillus albicereus]
MEMVYSTMLLLMQLMSGGNGPESDASHQMMASYVNAAAGKPVIAMPAKEVQAPDAGGEFVKKDPQPDAPEVKGIYATAHSAGGARLEKLLSLLNRTELNSMVVDIKDDYGYITYPTDNPELLKMGTAKKYIKDLPALMKTLEQNKVYPIARIVVFKDTVLAAKNPELSFVRADGSVWKNGKGDSFVNPYAKEVWDYNIAVAKEAVKFGFKEIQFDYVRFPEGFEKKADSLKYEKTDISRVDAVAGFVKYAREQMADLGVRVSVDIFGYAASVPAAEGIGQDFVKISKYVDVISPMVYPSHYSTGWYGADAPDTKPYDVIKGSMVDTHKKLDPIGSFKPVIRPWIQDFTASWLGKGNYIQYGKAEVEAQIRALRDTGVKEYLLWNAGNNYTEADYK